MPNYVVIGPMIFQTKNLEFYQFFFLLFRNYFPFENEMALQLYKVESSLPEDAFFQVWFKLQQGF